MIKFLKILIPYKVKSFIWQAMPKFHKVNTYLLKKDVSNKELVVISDDFYIKEVNADDLDKLLLAESYRPNRFNKKKIITRLNSPEWVGLAVIDKQNGAIAYIAWVVRKSILYIEEFGITLNADQFLLKDGFCVPHYRHRGLHSRMEQERISYCISQGAKEMFIQIHASNNAGIKSVEGNDYRFYKQNIVLQWPLFNIYRSLKGFLKSPFKRIVK